MKQNYIAPETDLLEIHLEVNFTDSTQMPDSGLGQIEGGLPFDDFLPQIW